MRANGWLKGLLLAGLLALLPFVLAAPRAVDVRRMEAHSRAQKIVVLNYHKIDEMPIALAVSPGDFERQMAYLRAQGYVSITPDQLVDHLEYDAPLPEKPLLITFDDGYEDNYVHAYPILKKYGFTATIFVVTDYLDRFPQYLTWEQARELKRAGFFIASHTMQHKPLTELDGAALRAELVGSAEALDYQLGKQSRFLAYPTGAYDLAQSQALKDCGYRAAFTVKYGNVDRSSYLYALERVPVFRAGDTFASFCERLRYIPLFERLGWIKS